MEILASSVPANSRSKRYGIREVKTSDIRKMVSMAIGNPELRDGVVSQLEKLMAENKGTKEGAAACKAAATILTVEMLEALKE
ncbi:MAG: hypothetical protein ACP5T3_00125 [Candidatus Micrarchaeia archaeon]